jgi:hypothetical protein
MENQGYERLLELRRGEHTTSIDRYVLSTTLPQRAVGRTLSTGLYPRSHHTTSGAAGGATRNTPPRRLTFHQLPSTARDKILEYALISTRTITLDYYPRALRFLDQPAKLPVSHDPLRHGNITYMLPRDVNDVRDDIDRMRSKMGERQTVNEMLRYARERRFGLHSLVPTLLRVSRNIHDPAARIFYGANTFQFPDPKSAFMTLEAFLATIGTVNAS